MTTESASSGSFGDRALGAVQNLGRSLMLPIAVLSGGGPLAEVGPGRFVGASLDGCSGRCNLRETSLSSSPLASPLV